MFKILRISKPFIFLLTLIFLMTIATFLIYQEYIKTKENVFDIIQDYIIEEKLHLLENYANYLSRKSGVDLVNHLDKDENLIIVYENDMKLLQGSDIKYLYLLYRDTDGKYRYLLDATESLDEKAEYKQKFDPQSSIWKDAYTSKRFQITKQRELETLWVSIAYPIVIDGEVIAVIGADFTYEVYTKIVHTLNPMESVYLYAIIFMMSMLLLAYLLVYMYYKSRKNSFIDPLTQIFNRQYLLEFFNDASLMKYQLMIIDLDNFKNINDTYGHDTGDEVLKSVVKKIQEQIRHKDIFIRFGGEEFLLFVHDETLKNCIAVANRIRMAIMAHKMQIDNYNLSVTLSIGINPFPGHAKNIEDAIKIADEQLYIAKSSGRNRVEVFQNDNKQETLLTKRISDVQLAIDEERIQCMFQPIFCFKEDQVKKYEVLVRLLDKNYKVISPQDFLPFIRQTNVYINITRVVLDTAIKTLEENDFELSINLDLQDILNADVISLLEDRLRGREEIANRLCIEILEHEEISNFELIQERMGILKELGLQVALDDFGSGYANFSYIINLQIDLLKIDGSLIRDIDKNVKLAQVLQSIISLAEAMGVKTVAEQVETEGEYKLIKDLGIDCVQGYYLGRPSFEFMNEED